MESEGVDLELLYDSSISENSNTQQLGGGGPLPEFRRETNVNVNTSSSTGDGNTDSKLKLGYTSPDNNGNSTAEPCVNSDIPPVTAGVENPRMQEACPSEMEAVRLRSTCSILLQVHSQAEAQLSEKQQELNRAYGRIAKVENDNLLATALYQELQMKIQKLVKDFKNERNGYETKLFEINRGLSSVLEKVKPIRCDEPGDYGLTSQFPVPNNASRMSQFPDIVEVDLETSLREQFNVAKRTLSEIQTTLGNSQSHADLEMCLELDPEDLMFEEETQIDGNERHKSNPSRNGVQMNVPDADEPAPRIMATFSANAISTSCPGSLYGITSNTCGDFAAVPQGGESATPLSSSSRLATVSNVASPAKKRKRKNSEPGPKESFQGRLASQPIIVGSSSRSGPQSQELLQQESLIHERDQRKSLPDGFLWCTCGSRYKNKAALAMHIRSQSQLVSYQCGSCNQEYMSYHTLKTHMKVQHNLICVLSTTPATSEST